MISKYRGKMFENIREGFMQTIRMGIPYDERKKMSRSELVKILNDTFFDKLDEIFKEYSEEIKISLINIEGMSREDATECVDTYTDTKMIGKTDSAALDAFIDILTRNSEFSKDEDVITQLVQKNRKDIQMQITAAVVSRDILNEKLGIPKNYKFEGKIGDNGIYNSQEFSLELVSTLNNIDISEEEFKIIYNKYSTDISKVIGRNTALKVYTLDDGIVYEPENTMKTGFEFISGKIELTSNSKIAVQEMILLIATYGKDKLLQENEQVKKELNSGLYDYIKATKERITSDQREKLYELTDTWNEEDYANHCNLELLKKRYEYIIQKGECKDLDKIKDLLAIGNGIINGEIPSSEETFEVDGKMVLKSTQISHQMKEIYSDFEKYNREDLIASIYYPINDQTIDKAENVPNNMLVHFYNPAEREGIETLFKTVLINREKIKLSETPIQMRSENFIEEYNIELKRFEKEILESSIEPALNELLPGESFKVLDTDQGHPRLDAIKVAGNQLATFLSSKEKIIELLEKNKRLASGPVAYAVGFSKDTISEDNIMIACNENANSNIGIENIPCEDKFVSLSQTYEELINSPSQRTEILLSRKFKDKKIEAGYLLCIYNKEQFNDSRNENYLEGMQQQINLAKNIGIPCIMVDIDQINKNEKMKEVVSHDSDVR